LAAVASDLAVTAYSGFVAEYWVFVTIHIAPVIELNHSSRPRSLSPNGLTIRSPTFTGTGATYRASCDSITRGRRKSIVESAFFLVQRLFVV
jgi:hypothetical protein